MDVRSLTCLVKHDIQVLELLTSKKSKFLEICNRINCRVEEGLFYFLGFLGGVAAFLKVDLTLGGILSRQTGQVSVNFLSIHNPTQSL